MLKFMLQRHLLKYVTEYIYYISVFKYFNMHVMIISRQRKYPIGNKLQVSLYYNYTVMHRLSHANPMRIIDLFCIICFNISHLIFSIFRDALLQLHTHK